MRISVIGGGVIGLSVAWYAARAGHHVHVDDLGSPHAGSFVAGGMLAPLSEAWPGEEPVTTAGLEALAMWPSFTESLGFELTTTGTCIVGTTAGDVADVRQIHSLQPDRSQLMTSREVRAREPALGPAVKGGIYVADDLAVDNRALLTTLREACLASGVAFAGGPPPDVTVIAAGAWSGGVHLGLKDRVRPIKGEILRLRHRPGALPPPKHTVRALVGGRPVYVVPRSDGVVVGATQYEVGFDTDVVVSGVRDLLRDAEAVVPGIAEYALEETSVGFRAGSPDNVPIVERLEPGVIAATGHHRNGLLMAPHTATLVLNLVEEVL